MGLTATIHPILGTNCGDLKQCTYELLKVFVLKRQQFVA